MACSPQYHGLVSPKDGLVTTCAGLFPRGGVYPRKAMDDARDGLVEDLAKQPVSKMRQDVAFSSTGVCFRGLRGRFNFEIMHHVAGQDFSTLTTYFQAFHLARKLGMKVVSNLTLDDYLVRSTRWNKERREPYLWTREMLIFPQSGGVFHEGADVIDERKSGGKSHGKPWVFPAELVPSSVVHRPETALFIEPTNLIEYEERILVQTDPARIIILEPFPQYSETGRLDPLTRIPLKFSGNIGRRAEARPHGRNIRRFQRPFEAGVRPIVRQVPIRVPLYGNQKPRGGNPHNIRVDFDMGNFAEVLAMPDQS